ncbi:MAG: hypothetical protein V4735_02925 [Pseudomonadota bacterium]
MILRALASLTLMALTACDSDVHYVAAAPTGEVTVSPLDNDMESGQ